MVKEKKGKAGESCKFISRAKAIRKLQVNIKDFRRLSILKGVYPREPPKKLVKKNLTYYHTKDINFLQHDRILNKFREMKAHLKKIKKAHARNETLKERKLKKSMPQYSLNHLIRERYPTFTDALRDLDDPLCLVNLFSSFHAHKDLGIDRKRIENCIQFSREFNLFVIKSKALRKVFLSIKGIYYQAEIQGQQITWIQPYQLPPELPIDVDYKVMLTFLEFYETMLKFVNYKLFTNLNIKYPVEIDSSLDSQQHFSYKSFVLKNKDGNLFDADNEKYQIDEKFKKELNQQSENSASEIFKGLVFFLSTEVPRYSLEFVILAQGGEVHWTGDDSEVKFDDKKITHYVTDRKPEHLKFLKNREYIQPQWVYDSVNSAIQLPVKDYAPGKILPPHLSPFKAQNDLYKPQREKELNKLQGKDEEALVNDSEDEEAIKAMIAEEELEDDEEEEIENEEELDVEEEEEDEEEEDAEEEEEGDEESEEESEEDEEQAEDEELSSEIVDEVKGGDEEEDGAEEYDFKKDQQKKQKLTKKQQREQVELAKTMMSKKNKTLYKLMQHKKEKAQKEAYKLQAKATRITRKQEYLDNRKNVTK